MVVMYDPKQKNKNKFGAQWFTSLKLKSEEKFFNCYSPDFGKCTYHYCFEC